MLVGRNSELEQLNNAFAQPASSILLLYGRTGIGKTSLIQEFIKDKDAFYYSCLPSAKDEARFFLANAVYGESELNPYMDHYEDVFQGIKRAENNGKKIVVIDEFTNISRGDKDFMEGVLTMVKHPEDFGRVLFVLISSSISYVEGNHSKMFGSNSSLVEELKLGALNFAESMHFLANYSMEDCIRLYGLTGGIPEYLIRINRKVSVEENIVRHILTKGAKLNQEGHNFVLEELRESASYNTILGCLSRGMLKINDIFNYTGFGRDKISVYLKNVIERDIVEKVYSYDISGKENIKKGCYRVTPGFINFWYRYLYSHATELEIMDPQEYYHTFIKDSLDEFCEEAFIQVCTDYLHLLETHHAMQFQSVTRGRIYEKESRIDVILEDEEGKNVIALCDFTEAPMSDEVLSHLTNVCHEERMKPVMTYLFSRNGFSDALRNKAETDLTIHLVDLKDL